MSKIDIPEPQRTDGSEEVASDAMQLFTVATFNGLCQLISSLAANGLLTAHQLDDIHDAMTTPLDDPDWRDDDFIADTRTTLETILSTSVRRAREIEQDGDDED